LGSLKKNKRMIRYKGGMSVENILVPSIRNTLMFRARKHMQEKDTRENPSMGQGVKMHRKKVLQGLRIRYASNGSVEGNMEPTLGQRHRNANVINKTQ
jgi:hypothetical protein